MNLKELKQSAQAEFLEKFCGPAGLNNYPKANTHDITDFLLSQIEKAAKEAINYYLFKQNEKYPPSCVSKEYIERNYGRELTGIEIVELNVTLGKTKRIEVETCKK